MKQKNKIVAGWLAFVFVVGHIAMISIYACPEQIMPASAKSFVSPYVQPIFTQRWNMFYPCPRASGRFNVRITYEDEQTDWFFPTDTDIKWYKRLRFTHHGEIVLLESGYIYWTYNDLIDLGWDFNTDLSQEKKEEFKSSYSYDKVRNYMKAIAVKEKGKDPIKVEVKVNYRSTVTGQEAEFEFPEYTWN
jgi:hypothetical protein